MVVYLIFNEGYTATSGDEWMRAALSEEALRLGRMLGQLLPGESASGRAAASEFQSVPPPTFGAYIEKVARYLGRRVR